MDVLFYFDGLWVFSDLFSISGMIFREVSSVTPKMDIFVVLVTRHTHTFSKSSGGAAASFATVGDSSRFRVQSIVLSTFLANFLLERFLEAQICVPLSKRVNVITTIYVIDLSIHTGVFELIRVLVLFFFCSSPHPTRIHGSDQM